MSTPSNQEPDEESSIVYRIYAAFLYGRPFAWIWFLLYIATGKVRRVPVTSLTNLGAFSYSQNGWHHFTAALKQIDSDPCISPETSILRPFYDCFRPDTRDGFLPAHANDQWNSTKSCYLPPWGGGKTVNFSDTFEHWTGPKDDESLSFVFGRLRALYSKIRSEGYRPWAYPDGYIRVCMLLRDDQDLRCLVVGGQHRAAIISHLGYRAAWVRLQSPGLVYPSNMPNKIKLKELDRWREVCSGLYTHQDARSFFEAYFRYDGKHQAVSLGLL